MPLVEFAAEAVAYGRARGIPVVVDIRDMWPDVWVEAMPEALRSLAAVATSPYAARLRGALRGSAAVVAITDPILAWGLKLAGMQRRAEDGVAPLAFSLPTITPGERAAAEAYWDSQGVSGHGFTAAYFGGLTTRTDPAIMIAAARAIPEADRDRVKIVICGDGDQLSALRAAAADLPHVLLPGWVDAPKILALQTRSKVGLIAYPNHMDFVLSVPNKVHEYWSAGLPVLSTLEGELARVLRDEGAGVTVARDPQAMADALIAMAVDRRRLAALADGAREAGRRRAPDLVYGGLRERLERLVHRQAAA
jgi:glycosyltransferase involved in cell wall biosynthesis